MPTTIPCPGCGGSGGHDILGDKPCMQCLGSGRDLNVPPPFVAPCKSCGGTGKKTTMWRESCKRCGGRGTLTY